MLQFYAFASFLPFWFSRQKMVVCYFVGQFHHLLQFGQTLVGSISRIEG